MNSKLTFLLLFAVSLQVSANELDERCELITDKKALLKPMNKSTICEETFKAVFESSIKEYDYTLKIEANGFQKMYSVELTKIEAFIGNDRVTNTTGVLHWNPDDSYVILD